MCGCAGSDAADAGRDFPVGVVAAEDADAEEGGWVEETEVLGVNAEIRRAGPPALAAPAPALAETQAETGSEPPPPIVLAEPVGVAVGTSTGDAWLAAAPGAFFFRSLSSLSSSHSATGPLRCSVAPHTPTSPRLHAMYHVVHRGTSYRYSVFSV